MAAEQVFSGNPLDRAGAERRDGAWLAAQSRRARARWLLMRELEPLVLDGPDAPRLAWVDGTLAGGGGEAGETVLLGALDGEPRFTVAVGAGREPPVPGTRFVSPREVAPLLPAGEAGMLAQARSLLDWHARHRFCARCGAATTAIEGGARRQCEACDARHYPRVDPSMIVLVAYGDRCLLARRPNSPPARHSCLAGYVEPGESIEGAVVREVLEETGVPVSGVRYHSSQPWPFPSTLMIGCLATASSERIEVDGVEIGSAAWFGREEVLRALAGDHPRLTLPGPIAIAHTLISAWAHGEV